MKKKTQKEIVLQQLTTKGVVSNLWAINHYILRLGAIIHKLRLDGMKIEGKYGKELGTNKKNWRNYYYMLEK